MRNRKTKLLSFLLSVVMVLTMLPATVFAAGAEDIDAFVDSARLSANTQLGSNVAQLSAPADRGTVEGIPTRVIYVQVKDGEKTIGDLSTGLYTLIKELTSKPDTVSRITNENDPNAVLTTGGQLTNAQIISFVKTLMPSLQLALKLNTLYGDSFSINVTGADGQTTVRYALRFFPGDIEEHTHRLIHVPRVEATWTAPGNIEYWECRSCGALFGDKDGKTEIYHIAIAQLPEPKIELSATSMKLKVRQSTKKFTVTMSDKDSIKSVKSSKTSVVKVSGIDKTKGTMTLTAQKKTGKATVTVTLESGLSAALKVTVQKGAVKATRISGVPKELSLEKGEKSTLKPTLSPITCVQKITYKSSKKSVATVSSKGKITAKKKGTATITVTAGSKKVKCKVTVK